MPELPEVEFARNVLARRLAGARITGATSDDSLVVRGDLDRLVGAHVKGVQRRGKRLRVAFDEPDLLAFSHLGMTGEWARAEAGAPALRFERLRIDAIKGSRAVSVRYVDPRRLGRFEVTREDTRAWRALGPDALADGIDAGALHQALSKRRATVKEALLDQRVLAGVGNIYAIEALWRARIDPRSRADALALRDVRALARGIRESLAFALRLQEGGLQKGAERAEYVNAGAPNRFRIYGHAGSPCPRCTAILAKMVLGGRGTTFCPGCQRRIR